MKKLFFFSLIFLLFSLGTSFCLAQRSLEVDYPSIRGYEIEETSVSFPNYVKYVYFFVIGISGFIGLGVLIWAGFQYLTSAGRPEKMRDAKDWITRCLIGLLILFLSWIIVNTINPELTILELKPAIPFVTPLPRGVILCEKQVPITEAWNLIQRYQKLEVSSETIEDRKQIKEDYKKVMKEIIPACITKLGSASTITHNFKYIYLVPSEKYNYGVILWEKTNFKGKTQLIIPQGLGTKYSPYEESTKLSNIASLRAFRLNPNPDPNWKVTLYAEQNFNIGESPDTLKKEYPEGGEFDWFGWYGSFPAISMGLQGSPKSIKMETDGHIIAILSKSIGTMDQPGESAVFTSSDTNLLDNEGIIEWGPCEDKSKGDTCPMPQATVLELISIY